MPCRVGQTCRAGCRDGTFWTIRTERETTADSAGGSVYAPRHPVCTDAAPPECAGTLDLAEFWTELRFDSRLDTAQQGFLQLPSVALQRRKKRWTQRCARSATVLILWPMVAFSFGGCRNTSRFPLPSSITSCEKSFGNSLPPSSMPCVCDVRGGDCKGQGFPPAHTASVAPFLHLSFRKILIEVTPHLQRPFVSIPSPSRNHNFPVCASLPDHNIPGTIPVHHLG